MSSIAEQIRREEYAVERVIDAARALVEHDDRARSDHGYLKPQEGRQLRERLRTVLASLDAIRCVVGSLQPFIDQEEAIAVGIVRGFVALRRRGPFTMHVTVGLDAAWEKWGRCLANAETGETLTRDEFEEARRHFKHLGYEVFPTCESFDERGFCAGHPSP